MRKSSKLAKLIMKDYRKELDWKKVLEREKEYKEKQKQEKLCKEMEKENGNNL